MRLCRAVVTGVTVAAFVFGCGTDTEDTTLPAATRADQRTGPAGSSTSEPWTGAEPSGRSEHLSVVAHVAVPEVAVYDVPGGTQPSLVLDNPTTNGGPLVFLVDGGTGDGWLNVQLPIRPNGSTGWIREADVELRRHTYWIVVELGDHRITVHRGDEVILDEPVGTGTGNTPTPGGRYYIKELLQPPDPDGPYGPFAYGLSGFSPALTTFNGGDATIGIHGTNDPASIGHDVSHGCIRMSNEGIVFLAGVLPLGTPVEILA